MKKYIIILIAIITIGFVIPQNLKFGVKSGLSIANLNGYGNAKSKIVYTIGEFVEIKDLEKIYVELQLLYILLRVTSSISPSDYCFSSLLVWIPSFYTIPNRNSKILFN